MSDALFTDLPYHFVREKLLSGEVSVETLVRGYLDRIQGHDEKLGAYLHVASDQALTRAQALDADLKSGSKPVGALFGLPLAPKDIYLTKGMPTTAGSQILEGYQAPYNSTVIERCLNEGAVLLGKLNMDEFAMGSSNENSAYKVSRNPWGLDLTPGGSSGGSAVAVSADLCGASLGTDTGGSIRQPASLCSVVGLKPTYGRVSRFGTIAYASSLDQMGPMTKDVRDAAMMMNVIAGYDENDSTSVQVAVPDYTELLGRDIRGMKVGIPKEYFGKGLDAQVESAVQKAISQLESLGAKVQEVSLPHTEYATSAYYVIAPAEASSNLSRYDGVRFGLREKAGSLNEMYETTRGSGFGMEVKRRILMGTYVLSSGYYDAYYIKAQKVRQLIKKDFESVFQSVDVLACPVSPTTAFRIGEKSEDPLSMYLSDILTISCNLGGVPGLSLPCGFDGNDKPIGLQLIGPSFSEDVLLQVGHAFEQSTDWHTKKPTAFL